MSKDHCHDRYDPNFYQNGGYFDILEPFYTKIPKDEWPDIDWFNNFDSTTNVTNLMGRKIHYVDAACGLDDALSYEEHIFHQCRLNTRLQNWHDFFNFMSWQLWPKTKAVLNARYVLENAKRLSQHDRSASQHFIAQFDECGIILPIVKGNVSLGNYLSNHQWSSLFVDAKLAFSSQIDCFILGHALFEKGLNPYIGWTAKAYILEVEASFFGLDKTLQRKELDNKVATQIWSQGNALTPKLLQPFPILGVPGWFTNQDEKFYANTQYFRGKSAKLTTLT